MKKVVVSLIISATLFLLLCSFGSAMNGADVDLNDYAGRKIGVLTGSIFDQMAKEYIKDPENSKNSIAFALIKNYCDTVEYFYHESDESPNEVVLHIK